jgi:hypothetical protein
MRGARIAHGAVGARIANAATHRECPLHIYWACDTDSATKRHHKRGGSTAQNDTADQAAARVATL